jgi:hypothetical protein
MTVTENQDVVTPAVGREREEKFRDGEVVPSEPGGWCADGEGAELSEDALILLLALGLPYLPSSTSLRVPLWLIVTMAWPDCLWRW